MIYFRSNLKLFIEISEKGFYDTLIRNLTSKVIENKLYLFKRKIGIAIYFSV